jgi:hypothetical protein
MNAVAGSPASIRGTTPTSTDDSLIHELVGAGASKAVPTGPHQVPGRLLHEMIAQHIWDIAAIECWPVVQEMKVGPSESPCGGRLQTTTCCEPPCR